MIRSHLVDAFTSQAWMLSASVYDRLSAMLEAHLRGAEAKDAWRADTSPLAFIFDDDEDSERPPEELRDEIVDGVAVIAVRGVLAVHADQVNGDCQPQGRSYESLAAQLAAAEDRADVRAIVLALETPGGSACGVQEIYDQIRACAKPVHAFIAGYAYSAGYYLATACQSITASSRSAGVGSIGCIVATWDSSSYYEDKKLRRVVVRSGPYKALGQEGEHIDSTATADLQRHVDAYAAAFYDAVAAGRGLSQEAATSVCTGATWLADEALGLDLIDAIRPLSALLTDLIASSTTPSPPGPQGAPMALFTPTPKAGDPPTSAPGLSKADLAALITAHPQAIERIQALDAEGKTRAEIEAGLSAEAIAALQAENATLTTQLAEAATAHTAALAERDAQIAALTAERDAAREFQASGGNDPGSDASAEAALGEPGSEARLTQEWAALSPARQKEYVSFESYCFCRRHGLGPDKD